MCHLISFFYYLFWCFNCSCCKVHDFCEADLDESKDRCDFRNKERYMRKRFKYDKETMKCGKIILSRGKNFLSVFSFYLTF